VQCNGTGWHIHRHKSAVNDIQNDVDVGWACEHTHTHTHTHKKTNLQDNLQRISLARDRQQDIARRNDMPRASGSSTGHVDGADT